MRILIGSTGFIGMSLHDDAPFDVAVHRSDVDSIRGMHADEIVCAGLPAEKWLANRAPDDDWRNVTRLASVLNEVSADRFTLISTIDVYSSPIGVDERTPADVDAPQAYGRNRAWFESFCRSRFDECLVVRLPGMFGQRLKKNLVFDLLHGRADQWAGVSASSTFQFYDVGRLPALLDACADLDVHLLNVAVEPVSAAEVAELFGVTLETTANTVRYDMRTMHDRRFGGAAGYLHDRSTVLDGIARLRAQQVR